MKLGAEVWFRTNRTKYFIDLLCIQAGGVMNILMFYIHLAYFNHFLFFPWKPHTLKAWEDKKGYFSQQSIFPYFTSSIWHVYCFCSWISLSHTWMLNQFGQFSFRHCSNTQLRFRTITSWTDSSGRFIMQSQSMMEL